MKKSNSGKMFLIFWVFITNPDRLKRWLYKIEQIVKDYPDCKLTTDCLFGDGRQFRLYGDKEDLLAIQQSLRDNHDAESDYVFYKDLLFIPRDVNHMKKNKIALLHITGSCSPVMFFLIFLASLVNLARKIKWPGSNGRAEIKVIGNEEKIHRLYLLICAHKEKGENVFPILFNPSGDTAGKN